MNLNQALERIEALEKRVKELESRPAQHIHYHQQPMLPTYVQPPYIFPVEPYDPWRWIPPPTITC